MRAVLPPPQATEGGAGRVVAGARLVEATAGGAVLRGHPAELARRLGVGAADLLVGLGELLAAGWLAVEAEPGGRLVVRWAEDAREECERMVGSRG
jgi:hypothetical protein